MSSLLCIARILAAVALVTPPPPATSATRPTVAGRWYTAWWTADDQYRTG